MGFVFQGEKTMIPYKEFDFLFNEITIPHRELDFQTPWKSNSEKMRPFFFQKMQFWKIPAVVFTLERQEWERLVILHSV